MGVFAAAIACFCHGCYVKFEEPKEPEISKEEKRYKDAAVAGDLKAQVNLGKLLLSSKYRKPEGFSWLKRAADRGNPDAQAGVGMCYLEGAGTEVDNSAGLEWVRKSALAGSAAGQGAYGLLLQEGRLLPRSYSEARMWYEKAAAQGDS